MTMHVYESVDEIAEAAQRLGFDLEYTQLEKGGYTGNFPSSAHHQSVFIDEGHTVGIAVDGTMFDCTCVVMRGHRQLTFNGQSVGLDELVFFMPGSEMHLSSHGAIQIPQLCLPTRVLAGFLNAANPDGGRKRLSSINRIRVGEDLSRWFDSTVRLLAGSDQLDNELAHLLEQRALATLAKFDHQDHFQKGSRGKGRPVEYYERRFSIALEYIRENLRCQVSLAELCEATNTSLRTLERIFKARTGMTPSQYILVCRLNAVRRELADCSRQEAAVSAVARKYGFAHLGRFSASYRQFYGEYPRDTLARAS